MGKFTFFRGIASRRSVRRAIRAGSRGMSVRVAVDGRRRQTP